MGGTAVQLLGIEQGNATMLSRSYDISSVPTDPVSYFANYVKERINIISLCHLLPWCSLLGVHLATFLH